MRKISGFFTTLIIIGVSFVKMGCLKVPDEIIMPQWDVELNVPIVNKEYTLDDIIKSQQYISVEPTANGDSIFVLTSDKYSQSTDINQFTEVTNTTVTPNQTVPAGIGEKTIYALFPENAEIDSAVLSGGFFAFNARNPSAVPVDIKLTIPGIKKPDGSKVIITTTVPALSSDSINYSFKNHHYYFPPNQPVFLKNQFKNFS